MMSYLGTAYQLTILEISFPTSFRQSCVIQLLACGESKTSPLQVLAPQSRNIQSQDEREIIQGRHVNC